MRQKDAKIVKSRNLSSLFYEIVSPLEHNLKTQMEVLAFLKEQNFEVNEFQKLAKNDQEIMFEINEFSKIKNNFEFDCDGFVIKFNLIDKW
ncbi:DNA ligase (NAD(+)), partial [Mycoplasmopsis synoviae]